MTDGSSSELRTLLKSFRSAFLVTRGADGLRGRPMAVQQVEGDASLWFASQSDSDKVADVRGEPECAVMFHDGQNAPSYISMAGTAELVNDKAKVRELWNPGWKLWFPDGPDETDLILIRFQPAHVEYLVPQGGTVGVLASAIKRLVTHEKPTSHKAQVDLGTASKI